MFSISSVTVLLSLLIFSSFHHFQPFNNSSILHISPFYCLPSFLSSKKLPSLPFWVSLIDFFIPKNSLLICENITDFFFGTFYALELRFIWRGHINLYLLGFAFTLRISDQYQASF
ncbi:hypothetical protein P8452_04559 [Trifolium repens]|nr:hypothetical protein P8452_04559 [Trifolium repens]